MKDFPYKSLDRNMDRPFRRLELLPGTGQINCKLQHVFLADNPQYEAISYHWGPTRTEFTHEIICDGLRSKITESLHCALMRFRKTDGSRFLWADQICINQDDKSERAFQVSMMREIYENAYQTLIWLGNKEPKQKNDDPDEAFKLLEILATAHEKRRARTPPDKRTLFELSRAEVAELSLPSVISAPVWKAVWLILSRQWFHRLWVIQEVTVSRQVVVHCSRSEIAWSRLVSATTCAFELAGVLHMLGNYSTFGASVENVRKARLDGKPKSLTSMLIEFSHYGASDPRDKVFSLLGLASAQDRKLVEIDYRSPPETTYLNTTVAILKQSRNLDILCAVNRNSEKEAEVQNPKLPTWVRDYKDSPIPTALCLMPWHNINSRPRMERGPRFRASGLSQSEPAFSDDLKKLSLKGFVLDTVARTALPQHPPRANQVKGLIPARKALKDGTRFLEALADWKSLIMAHGPKYSTGEDTDDVYWQILIGGCSEEERDEVRNEWHSLRGDTSYYNTLHRYSLARFRLVCFLVIGFIIASAMILAPRLRKKKVLRLAFLDRMVVCTGRRMVKTASGRLGLAPAGCMVGDKIVLCRGGSMPLVLRQDGCEWKLIGAAYIHGIMYGEAYEDQKCETIALI